MFKQLFLFAMVVVVGFCVTAPHAEAADLSAALKRMDAIIAEMQSLRAEFASLVSVTSPVPAVQGSVSGSVLGADLAFGSTNDDIKRIQTLLATDPAIYPYGVASGYFGPKTQEAIRSFQARFNLDTVGVVGPSTRALLDVFFAAYPTGNYPDGVLAKSAPTVAGVSTIVDPVTTKPQVPATTGTLESISISEDEDEFIVRSYKANGTRNRDLVLYSEDGDELVEMIAQKLGASESEVRSLVDEDDLDFGTSKKSLSRGADEGDAEDALDDADSAIDDARDEIKQADDDGDDVADADELYDEARSVYKEAKAAFDDEDYDEAVELAEEAEGLADEAIDELGGRSSGGGDIDFIEVEVLDGEAKVVVEYDNGHDEKFTVEEDAEEDIIREIADELDISENDVEDLVEFDYGEIDKITTSTSNGDILIRVYLDSGLDVKFTFDEGTDEDDIIAEIAKALNLSKSDVERDLDL